MLKKEELKQIEGGAVTAAFITAIIGGIKVVIDLGRSLGTAIRRIQGNNLC